MLEAIVLPFRLNVAMGKCGREINEMLKTVKFVLVSALLTELSVCLHCTLAVTFRHKYFTVLLKQQYISNFKQILVFAIHSLPHAIHRHKQTLTCNCGGIT